jgi:hypothetical protein
MSSLQKVEKHRDAGWVVQAGINAEEDGVDTREDICVVRRICPKKA